MLLHAGSHANTDSRVIFRREYSDSICAQRPDKRQLLGSETKNTVGVRVEHISVKAYPWQHSLRKSIQEFTDCLEREAFRW